MPIFIGLGGKLAEFRETNCVRVTK